MIQSLAVAQASCRGAFPRYLLHRITTLAISAVAALVPQVIYTQPVDAKPGDRPNIVLIMVDDMGFGDVHALNADSTIPTPNLDRLATDGMTFTDAHTPSAVCTPTRYGLLTGRYCWRTRLKRGVLGGYSPPLIDAKRSTIATMLKARGYFTAGVGKWHLGMGMPMKPESKGDRKQWQGDPGIDFGKPIADSPVTRGFDYFFAVSASLDMAPYVYIENDRFTMLPTQQQAGVPFPAFVRTGPRAKDFVLEEVLDRLAAQADKVIQEQAKSDSPFFVYFPLTAPHKPTLPHKRFRGKSKLGPYGDFIMQVDATVGQVLKTLDKTGQRDSTLVIFTSDNGSYMHRYDDAKREDHLDKASIQGYRADRHRANGPFRGTKADIWEAGHHVPFFARWPGKIEAGAKCDEPICLTDVFATCAEICGASLGDDSAEDSISLLSMMKGNDSVRGVPVIHHSVAGMFAIRDGQWKLVLGNGSGGREKPSGKPFGKPYQLFNVVADVGETTNLAPEQPDVVKRLVERFQAIHDSGRSVQRSK